MKKRALFNTVCLYPAVATALSAGVPAWAQATDVRGTDEAGQGGGDIVVTGSRIARPNLTSSVPIASIEPEEVLSTGDISLGDALNDLPSLRASASQATSGRGLQTTGLNLLDLRGLGTTRTLVLVNGRRHVTTQAGIFTVDVNTIPSDLIERVDIVTGGNSAIYGSDAIAGVVNFVLRRDFEGLRVRGQAGISEEGDRGNYFVSVTAGRNFADDRGNVAINLEYARAETLPFTARDGLTGAFSGKSEFVAAENTGGIVNPSAGTLRPPETAAGNGFPDTVFIDGSRSNIIADGGMYTATCPAAPAPGETDAQFQARRAAACSGIPNPGSANPLAQFGRTFVFLPDGTLIPNPCVTDLRSFNSSQCVGGLGSTFRTTGFLTPGLARKMANLVASFEVSPAFRLFLEAKYVNVTADQEGQPTFLFTNLNLENPFLSPQARALIQSTLAPGQTAFPASRFNVDFGGSGGNVERQTYRAVIGAEGQFNGDWRYEVALNYGRLETFTTTNNNVRIPRQNRAIDAVRNAQGQIVCRVNADTNPANDDLACVPADIFGSGRPSEAALAYFGHTSTREERAEQFNATAFVSGDLSQLFELPGGPVGFAVGVEYRREEAFLTSDPITQSGQTYLTFGPTFAPPAYEIMEAFAELRIPLITDRPFFRELSIEAAGRVSDYNLGSTGTIFAYNIGGIWAPMSGLRLRGGYARAVRAPTLSNLFQPPAFNSGPVGLVDPCAVQNINNNPNRVANCAAAGVPTTQTFTVNGATSTQPFSNLAVSNVSGLTRGNPELEEEQGRSLTIGFVAQPAFIPGLTISADFYDITITNAIFSLGAQQIINLCYDSPSGIDNQYCAVVGRNPNGTFAGQTNVLHAGGTVSFPATGASFIQQPFNFARQVNTGIDADVGYRTRLGRVGLDLRALVSYVIRRNNFTNVEVPGFSDRQKSELGDPAWRAQLSARFDFGNWDFGYTLRYFGRQTIGLYEAQNSHQGRPPQNPDLFPRIWYPSVVYHNFRLGFDVGERFNLYAGVDNAFDRQSPFNVITSDPALGTAGAPWDLIGRYFYVGVTTNF